ncbi:hypothetical protein MMC29_002154, partial [Sticta canariensis]|nr:hypothetical protein [Sticta canariensis]
MQERLDAIERKAIVAHGTLLLKACLQKYHAMHKPTRILGPQLHDARSEDSWFPRIHFNTDDADVGSQNSVQTAERLDKGRYLRDTGLSMECFTLLKQYPKFLVMRKSNHESEAQICAITDDPGLLPHRVLFSLGAIVFLCLGQNYRRSGEREGTHTPHTTNRQ